MTTITAPVPRSASFALSLLRKIQVGKLHVVLPSGSKMTFGEPGSKQEATLILNNWNALTRALKSGDIGFAEGFIEGDWTSPNLAALLLLLVSNRKQLDAAIYGTWWGRLAYRIKHLLNRNSKEGSKKNIQAHYDLGNSFYKLWLDPTMSYSSALFENGFQESLESASWAKVRRALKEAGVKQGDTVLEIGCGWGGLAELAGREFGAKTVGVTLSHEQLAYANERMRASLIEADLRLQDYRDINDGPFDAVCSIEMFEAVGKEYWASYFETVSKQLKSGGKACIQVITIDDALFERYSKSTDFIQQYVFPGGMLPSKTEFIKHAEAAGLQVTNSLAFGRDYAETLRRWKSAFLANLPAVRAAGFDDRFIRIWEFYLVYCEAGFDSGNTDVVQFTLKKP